MLTSVDRLLFVRQVPIFSELRDDFLIKLVSVMDELSFPEKHTIFTEGQEGRALYIVVRGEVKVHLQDGQILAELSAGSFFGEMSLFDADPRSASVTTLSVCDCLILTQHQLYEAIDETPGIAINIIRELSKRVRDLNNDLKEKQQENQALPPPTGLRHQAAPPRSPMSQPLMPQGMAAADTAAEDNGSLPFGGFIY